MSDPGVVPFRVVRPRQPTYHYVWDAQQLRLRVDKLTQPERQLPADYGMVHSQTWGHALMPGLLFGSAPVAADALVPGRILGGLRAASSGEVIALLANAVDPQAPAAADGAEMWLQAEAAAAELLPGEEFERQDAAATEQRLRQLQRQAWVSAVGAGRPVGRAWQALGTSGQRPPELSHTYSPAEYSLWRLPWRYQLYAPDLVVSDERVHYFVYRPEWRGGLLKRTALNEGLLMLTDRQVLFLEDAIPPGMAMARWGYRAKSIAVERLTSVEVARKGGLAELTVTAAGNGGDERVAFSFSADAGEQLRFACELLQPFLPGRQPRALLRLYTVASPRGLRSVNPAYSEVAYLQQEVLTARTRFSRQLVPDEELLADSLLPPMERGQPARWLAVTRSRLILATEGAPAPLELSFGDLTSIELQYCVMASYLCLSAGRQRWQFDFYSTWFPALHSVYFAVRQCLAQPLAALSCTKAERRSSLGSP